MNMYSNYISIDNTHLVINLKKKKRKKKVDYIYMMTIQNDIYCNLW